MFEALMIVSFGAFFAGASVASYLLVCASRLEAKRNGTAYAEDSLFRLLTTKRSHCPSCSKPLAFYELIPVVSYAIQLGSCRRCGSSIGMKSLLTEAGAGTSAVLLTIFALGVWPDYSQEHLVSGLALLGVTMAAIAQGALPRFKVTIKTEVPADKK